MYKVYLLPGDENDATAYYVQIIKEAIALAGEEVDIERSLKNIKKTDKVITLHGKAFFYVWLKNRKQYIINWFQGIVPEEVLCHFENSLSKYPRKILWEFFERLALKRAEIIFFVSNAMLLHYKEKYKYRKCNYILMPCFNQGLNKTAFTKEKYATPTFVYAGSLSSWQCIEQTLELYQKIKKEIPRASLTLLTADLEKAYQLLGNMNMEDVCVKYIPYESLNSELGKYKYGLIIRKDIEVNKVATPTKMNSYIANGVIPVFSDVIIDFRTQFAELKYVIKVPQNMEECITDIIRLEQENILPSEVLNEYELIFKKYYSKQYYVKKIYLFMKGKK